MEHFCVYPPSLSTTFVSNLKTKCFLNYASEAPRSPLQDLLSAIRSYPVKQEQLKPRFRSLQTWAQPPLLTKHSLTSVDTQTHRAFDLYSGQLFS